MDKYHKIHTVYLRDPDNRYKTLLEGQYALPEFEYLARNKWIFTEKVDGTNVRIHWDMEHVQFGGRTDKAQMPVFLYDRLNDLFPEEKFSSLYPEIPMTLYGEGYGARIQKGGGNYIPDGVSFILFDVKINGNWLDLENVVDIGWHLSIDIVPVIRSGHLIEAVELARIGFQSRIGSQTAEAEGIVMRPAVELQNRRGQRVITKIKHKDF